MSDMSTHEPSVGSVKRQFSAAVLLILLTLLHSLQHVNCISSGVGNNLDSSWSIRTRVISLQELLDSRDAVAFFNSGLRHFSRMASVPTKRSESFYVAAEDCILRIAIDSFEPESRTEWSQKLTMKEKRLCRMQGISQAQCSSSSIFALITTSTGKLITCGWHAGRPVCSLTLALAPTTHRIGFFDVKLGNSDTLSEKVMTAAGDQLFVGAFLRRRRSDPAMYRLDMAGRHMPLRTVQVTQQGKAMKPVLNPAKFVSVHIIGQYAYYFFQETAEETTTLGSEMQSVTRVARMCRDDPGHRHRWLSFAKATLLCSVGNRAGDGGSPFVYRHLRDTFATDTHVYGLFTASDDGSAGPVGSAICAFPISHFDSVFNDLAVMEKRWKRSETGKPFSYIVEQRDRYNRSDCQMLHKSSSKIAEYTLKRSQQFLKAKPVVQQGVEPVAIGNETWLRLVVEKLQSSRSVAFVLTHKQTVKKLELLEGQRCWLEEIQLDKKLDVKVNDMLLVGDHLLIATEARVLKMPTCRCHRHRHRDDCLKFGDPHCGWNYHAAACTTRPTAQIRWQQHLPSTAGLADCQTAESQVAGVNEWSEWQKCNLCSCRYRLCRGEECRSQVEVQVTNCTVNGGWGSWSEWSRCDRCSGGWRTRTRRCDTQNSQNGGVGCDGQTVQTQRQWCRTNVCNDSTWSSWGAWQLCSQPCDGGIRRRERRCLPRRANYKVADANIGRPQSKRPDSGGCIGESTQWQECNTGSCSSKPVVSRTSWIRTQPNANGVTRWMSFVASCSVGQDGQVRIAIRNRSRECHSAGECENFATSSQLATESKSALDSVSETEFSFQQAVLLCAMASLVTCLITFALTCLAACGCARRRHRRQLSESRAQAEQLSVQLGSLKLAGWNDFGRETPKADDGSCTESEAGDSSRRLLLLNNLNASSRLWPPYQSNRLSSSARSSFDAIRSLKPRVAEGRENEEEEDGVGVNSSLLIGRLIDKC